MRGRVVSKMLALTCCLLALVAPGALAALEPPTMTEAKYLDSSKGIELRWSPVRDAVAYNVYRSKDPGTNRKLIGSVPDARYSDRAVNADTTYYYAVTYLTSGFMESPFSEEWAVASGPKAAGEDAKALRAAPPAAPAGKSCKVPGIFSTAHPGSAAEVLQVDGRDHFYKGGVFWAQREKRYVVVAAPVGAEVRTLPFAADRVQGGVDGIFYWCGTFFGEEDGKYQVLAAPIGAQVGYLPGGFTKRLVDGNEVFTYQETCFSLISTGESAGYEVIACSK